MPLQDPSFSIGADKYVMPFSELSNAVIGVEATSYLEHMIRDSPSHEPLLAALGGDPISLKYHIKLDLDKWKDNKMRPYFVFDGQSVVGKDDMALLEAKAALLRTRKAWELYSDNHPEEAVKSFGLSGAVRARDLYRILQQVLQERNLDFMIAPSSACAQLAYLDNLDAPYIDGIMGSQELLLYNINDAYINVPTSLEWDKKEFNGGVKSDLKKKLNITDEMLSDALLMVGTSFLPTFPPLLNETVISQQPFALRDAINLLRTTQKSVTNTCNSFHDILEAVDRHWLDKYRKAKMSVMHPIVIQEDGVVQVIGYESLTSDNHEYLGLQLPAELYFYLSKALIGPRIMNCFAHLRWDVLPTLDGVDSEEYRRLMTRSLVPLKETSAALLSSRIHRIFQIKEITMSFWFDDNLKQTFIHRNMQPQLNNKTDSWGVKDSVLKSQESSTGYSSGKLSFALLSLQVKGFSPKTIVEKASGLKTTSEILSNTLWRLLHLRGYINDQHELTSWGKALATTLKSVAPLVKKYKDIHHIEEAACIAFELIRFDQLNSRNRHTELIGGPLRGSDEDKANCILIGRTSCLLKLRHDDIGYTGPLSKNFLSFHSIIKAVRETDRDLLEAIVASMFLSVDVQAERNRTDYQILGQSLPFTADVDISLGIAVKTYLDDFLKPEWTADERTANKAQYVEKYLPHSINFSEDLDVAFKFFDAVHQGVQTLGSEMSDTDKKSWEDASAYLTKRR